MNTSETRARRVVVTGHAPDGTAVFVQDRAVDASPLGDANFRATLLWGRDDIPSFPNDGAIPELGSLQPPPGGCRFSTLTIPAGANQAYFDFIVAALGDLAEPEEPGFHVTPTLDFIYVLDGEFELELDGGVGRRLVAGDTAVLNAVRHRWSNPGGCDASLLAMQIGGENR